MWPLKYTNWVNLRIKTPNDQAVHYLLSKHVVCPSRGPTKVSKLLKEMMGNIGKKNKMKYSLKY